MPENIPYFFSVRHPISRFKSAFYSRQRKGQPRLYNEWTPEEALSFSNFEHANDLAEALYLENETGLQAFWAMNNIEHVSSHQLDWFDNSGYFLDHRQPIFIVRQERFNEDFSVFLKRAALNVEIGDLDIAKDNKKAHAFDYSSVPELSDLARSNLESWYKRDFEFYKACVKWIEANSFQSFPQGR